MRNKLGLFLFGALTFVFTLPQAIADQPNLDGWKASSPREEIRPAFESSNDGGHIGNGVLSIGADDREGLMGHWRKTVAVQGGQNYQFSVWRRTDGIDLVRRAAIARVIWLDKDGQRPLRDEVSVSRLPAEKPRSEPEFPIDGETDGDWTSLVGNYHAPSVATQAVIELHFRWGPPGSSVSWSDPTLISAEPLEPRVVRLATVHYRPKGGTTNREKCGLFAPLIADAAKQKTDLVVLPETSQGWESPIDVLTIPDRR